MHKALAQTVPARKLRTETETFPGTGTNCCRVGIDATALAIDTVAKAYLLPGRCSKLVLRNFIAYFAALACELSN